MREMQVKSIVLYESTQRIYSSHEGKGVMKDVGRVKRVIEAKKCLFFVFLPKVGIWTPSPELAVAQ